MKRSKLIRNLIVLLVVFPIAASIISPPDFVCQITLAVEMVIVYGFLTLVISRFKSLAQTPENVKKLIFILVCLLSISIVYCVTLFLYLHQMKIEFK